MIWNKLCDSERLCQLHPGFAAAFDFLHRQDLAELPVGTYEIDGKRVYAMIQKGIGKGVTVARLETHRRYIDIQYTISGNETIGCAMAAQCLPDTDGWNLEKDVVFFREQSEFLLPVPPGYFSIFFPEEDAHAPWAGTGEIHKAVIKVEL